MAYISKGAQLIFNFAKGGNSAAMTEYNSGNPKLEDVFSANTNWIFPGLQEIGAVTISGAGGSYDKIEVTTLADHQHVYVDGLLADTESESNEISCKFLYQPDLFKMFKDVIRAEKGADAKGKSVYAPYVIAIPQGGHFTLEASIASIAMDTVSTNSALTFSVTFAVRSIDINTTDFVQTTAE